MSILLNDMDLLGQRMLTLYMFLFSSLLTQRMPQHCTSKMTVCREKHSTGSYKIFIRVGADKE